LAKVGTMKLARCLLQLAATCALVTASAQARPVPDALHLSNCTLGHERARCGTLNVWEDRGKQQGRTIGLRVVIIPAVSHNPGLPIYPLAGGPGQSIVDIGPALLQSSMFRHAHATHDIVLVDQRGTGHSHPLNCDLFPTDQSMMREDFPLDAIRACREKLSADANLTMYGSGNAADDLDELASALHHEKIIVFGGSYGTTLALVYLRRHPSHVASEVLEAVATPRLRLPLPFPRGGQRALDDLAAACNTDAACHGRFPNFRKEFEILNRASEGGLPADFVDRDTHERVHDVISHEVFADRMRQALYSEDIASSLPAIVHAAVAGHNTAPVGRLIVMLTKGIVGQQSMGLNLSISCSEALAFIDPAEAQRESRGTFMGDSRYRAQRAACDVWDVPAENRHFLDPIPSNVPVLMISGEDDPATPPQFGAEELRYLPNGRQLIVPAAGHFTDSDCVNRLEAEVFDGAAPRSLDASCIRRERRPPFYANIPTPLR
jgi:pimeloyl-ACP methyl ester carboxylesterase